MSNLDVSLTRLAVLDRAADHSVTAFQYALAQAFIDQVGQPGRLTIRQLHALLIRVFQDALSEAEWNLVAANANGTVEITKEYGTPTTFYSGGLQESPDEWPEAYLQIPATLQSNWTAKVPFRNVAAMLFGFQAPFFRAHRHEILAFFLSSSNSPLFKRFFQQWGALTLLDAVDFTEVGANDAELHDIHAASLADVDQGLSSQAGPGSGQAKDVEFKMEPRGFIVSVEVDFTCSTDAYDYEFEPGQAYDPD